MDAWVYERSADLELSGAERMRRFPRDPDMTVCALRSTVHVALRTFLRAYNRFDVAGRENLPAGGSFIMVCNHSSHFDALCLLSSLPLRTVHRAFPAAAADYFFSSRLRSVLSVIVVNGLPFDREHHGAASLEVCRQLLAGPDNVLIMFPEGTRSSSGELGRFRSGVARLVAGTGTPVVPCHLSGAYEAWPKGRLVPRPGRLRLHIGRPRAFPDVSPADPEAVISLAAQLRDDVATLGIMINNGACGPRGESESSSAAARRATALSCGERAKRVEPRRLGVGPRAHSVIVGPREQVRTMR
jgi:1-acyl-sn-glycerol-3-phosphate acyltransferase